MASSEIEPESSESDRRFANLRGVQWRVNLGVLPSRSSSIDELRRETATSRRRYALLRKTLLTHPQYALKDSPNLFIDNPLSLNPGSSWGQLFRKAELERTLDQDLSRLYPEHWCYFQAPGCQGMLRRILFLWCLKHPEFGYKQGMHELLAPLLYVLHLDVKRLSEVRKNYQDCFTDRFDSLSFEDRDITHSFYFNKFLDSMDDEIGSQEYSKRVKGLEELDPEVQLIVMLSDSYGVESELGNVMSEKFMEHDAYSMFDALMSGPHGCVAMAAFFGYSPASGSHTGLPPVLEACTAFYRLLALVDSSLHSHLVELGVEPQYFGLRWLRVLFGREFLLQDLLLVWDEIFSANNSARTIDDGDDDNRNYSFRIFDCPRGILITGMAVSMIVYLRSSLLSTENATSCLQRLLNFPENIDLNKIIQNAKALQALVLDADVRSALSTNGVYDQSSSVPARTKSFPSGSTSPKSHLIITPESYWEEKWRVLNQAEEEEERQSGLEKESFPIQKNQRWLKVTKLFRAVTDLSHYKTKTLLEDLSQKLRPNAGEANPRSTLTGVDCPVTVNEENSPQETEEGILNFHSADEESITSGNVPCEDYSSVSPDTASLVRDSNYLENDSESRNGSTLFPDEIAESPSEKNPSVSSDPVNPASECSNDSNYTGNDSECSNDSNSSPEENYKDHQTSVDSPLHTSPECPVKESNEDNAINKSVSITKVHKLIPVIVQWFWKFRRSLSDEATADRNASDATKSNGIESNKNQVGSYSECYPQALASGRNGDSDQNLMKTVKNLGQSMLKHIQVIELVFQQQPGLVQAGLMRNFARTNLIGKGQGTATKALKELRIISNLLSEM